MPGHAIDFTPYPTVNPTGAPSGDFERIQASPEMFGGLVAQSEQKLGQGLEHASQEGFSVLTQKQNFDNTVHTAEIHSWMSDQATDLQSKFSDLRGKAASMALPDYKKSLDDLYQQAEDKAGSPAAKAMIASQSRRLIDNFYEIGTRHADTEKRTYYEKTAKDNAASFASTAGVYALNGRFKDMDDNLFWSGQEVRNYYGPQGYDKAAIDVEVSKRYGENVKNIVESFAKQGKFDLAEKMFEKYDKEIDPASRLAITSALRAQRNQIEGDQAGSRIIADTHAAVTSSTPARMTQQGYTDRLFQIESGGNTQAVTGSNRGLGQFGPREMATFGITDWTNPDQQRRAVAIEAQVNAGPLSRVLGRQPTAGELYLAHQQGQAGAIAILSHPELPAWQAIRPYYASDRIAKQAITDNSYDQLKGVDADQISARTFADYWISKFERGTSAGVALTPVSGAGGTGAPAVAPASFTPGGAAIPASLPGSAGTGVFASPLPPKSDVLERILSDPELQDNPQKRAAAEARVHREYEVAQARQADQERYVKQTNEYAKQLSDSAEGEILKDIYGPSPKVTAEAVVNNPALTREARERLVKQVMEAPGKKDEHTYGRGFLDAYKQVHAPAGDPGRITDPSQLYGMVGHSLTLAGADRLIKEIQDRKSPEGDAEAAMKKQFFEKVARPAITFENEQLKLQDPGGSKRYLQFLAYAMPAYDEGRRAGKTPAQLLNPESSDYIGKAIPQFQEDPAQAYHDKITAPTMWQNIGHFFGASLPPVDPKSINSLAELHKAFQDGRIAAKAAADLALEKGWGARTTKPEMPRPPIAAVRDANSATAGQ